MAKKLLGYSLIVCDHKDELEKYAEDIGAFEKLLQELISEKFRL